VTTAIFDIGRYGVVLHGVFLFSGGGTGYPSFEAAG
jgi:hypothetical protein